MALGSTVHTLAIALSDVDRGVYTTLDLRVAQHPSESTEYLVARVLAYALEHEEGIAFSQGLGSADQPAVWVHDPTGRLLAWIEVGTPDPERVHKASKASERVVVYCHKDVPQYLRTIGGKRVHAPERVTIVALPRPLVGWLASRVERRTALALSITEGELFVECGGDTTACVLERHPWPAS